MSHLKRSIRWWLLVILAGAAVTMGFFLALPILFDDPSLALEGEQRARVYLILGTSVVATFIVHIATKSWVRPVAPPQPSEQEGQNGT